MKLLSPIVFFLVVWMSHPAIAQDVFSPYYVVIGGFGSEENAQKYCNYAHEQNLPAVYAFNAERKIYYVYVRATQTKDVADDIRNRLRAGTVFREAWVFNGPLSGSDLLPQKQPAVIPDEPVAEEPVVVIEDPVVEAPEEEAPSSSVPENTRPQVEAPKPVGKPFVFKLFNKETGNMVNGLVRLQESDRAKQFRGVDGNQTVYVPAPANRSGRWFVTCHVVGFQPFQKQLDYDNPQSFEGASIGSGDAVIVPLTLERVRRGDYIELTGVKFYNNAALFTPGSERELYQLIAMMEENHDYQIRLHGHTNGRESRDIVSIGESDDFFNPNLSNTKEHGSAKDLSLLRAELVKTYLIHAGIDASRITTKGEGGRQMIFDPSGTLAGMNDRVEVEIRKH